MKVAVTFCAALMATVQVPVPVQAPLQPVKVEPDAAAAVRVTLVPLLKFVLHVLPQLTPLGEELTVPVPVPPLVIVNVYVTGIAVKVAVTLCAEVRLTVQVPVPEHAPLQPVKVEPDAAAAVRVTDVPLLKLALHVLPQLIPAGDEVTVPVVVTDRA